MAKTKKRFFTTEDTEKNITQRKNEKSLFRVRALETLTAKKIKDAKKS